ncbi:9213_t:CDS:1, partial [Entrophospora sp. SA101]
MVSPVGIGTLKQECVVCPPCNNNDAIPEEATANAILLLACT